MQSYKFFIGHVLPRRCNGVIDVVHICLAQQLYSSAAHAPAVT